MSSISENRYKLYLKYVERYKELAKSDPRYKKTLQKISEGKENFMAGKPMEQVIKGGINSGKSN